MNRYEPAVDTEDGFERPRGRAQRWAVLIGRAILLAATLALTSGIDGTVAKATATPQQPQAGAPQAPAQAATAVVTLGGRTTWR